MGFQWHSPEFLQHVTYAFAALTAAITFWQRARMRQFIMWCWSKTFGRPTVRIAEEQTAQRKIMNEILEQVRPNGHGSIQSQLHGITARQEEMNERQLDMSALFYARMDAEDQAALITDVDGQLRWVSQAYKTLTGHDLAKVKGNGWMSIIYEKDRERVFREWETVVAEQIDWVMTFRIRCAAGNIKTLRAKITRKKEKGDSVIRGYLVYLDEVTGEHDE